MYTIQFIHDGRHKGWRYKQGETVTLPDSLGQLAVDEGVAKILAISPRRERQVDVGATRATSQAGWRGRS